MKIESISIKTAAPSKTNIPQNQIFEKGQIISGKIISNNGETIDILLSSGKYIKATSPVSINLPLNVDISFEVIEFTSNMVHLKPVAQNIEYTEDQNRMVFQLSNELGIQPTKSNIDFIDSYNRTLLKNVEILHNMLIKDGNTAALKKLHDIFISPERLETYLRNFNEEDVIQLIIKLEELFIEIKNSNPNAYEYSKAMSDILKGFSMQINHEFPLFFIPIPLFFNNKFYPGEMWIEKDVENNKSQNEQLSVYLFLDTPVLGRIEGVIRIIEDCISANLFCNKEILPFFTDNIKLLKDRLESAGVSLKSIGIHELIRNSNFKDLAKKYIHPLPSVDIKI